MKTFKQYLKEWDEPLNEGFLDKAKNFIGKFRQNFRGLLMAAGLGILLLGNPNPTFAQSPATQQVEEIVDDNFSDEDKQFFIEWVTENANEINSRIKNFEQKFMTGMELASQLRQAALQYYGNSYEADKYVMEVTRELQEKIIQPTVLKEMKKLNLLKEGKDDEFIDWVIECGYEADEKVMDFMREKIKELKYKSGV